MDQFIASFVVHFGGSDPSFDSQFDNLEATIIQCGLVKHVQGSLDGFQQKE